MAPIIWNNISPAGSEVSTASVTASIWEEMGGME
jgi:hypothetical protein